MALVLPYCSVWTHIGPHVWDTDDPQTAANKSNKYIGNVDKGIDGHLVR